MSQLCTHVGHYLARAGASNGVGLWCPDCERWATVELKAHTAWALPKTHTLLEGVDRRTLPRVNAVEAVCEICQQTTRTPELHHWCPRALYADQPVPDEGPQAYLCPPCHATWHRVVTPGLLPLAALALVRSLYKRLRKQPGAWAEFVRVVNDADAAVRRVPTVHERAA